MIKQRLQSLKNKFQKYHIDGYVVPKNDEFFSEYSAKDRLKFISNFSGSAGFAVILKKKNFLFVDSRYTIQAQLESKKNFEIVDFYKIINCNYCTCDILKHKTYNLLLNSFCFQYFVGTSFL